MSVVAVSLKKNTDKRVPYAGAQQRGSPGPDPKNRDLLLRPPNKHGDRDFRNSRLNHPRHQECGNSPDISQGARIPGGLQYRRAPMVQRDSRIPESIVTGILCTGWQKSPPSSPNWREQDTMRCHDVHGPGRALAEPRRSRHGTRLESAL